MRKLIASINMTFDGYCDHTAAIADDGLHQHFTGLLHDAGVILYGRITYQLMESAWPEILKNPTGNKQTDDFAAAIDKVPKVVFSRTLKKVEWETASLASRGVKEEVAALKQQAGKDVFVGSPSLIVQCTNLGLIDEYQLVIHPVIEGKGLPLFKAIKDRIVLQLEKTKTLSGGHVVLYYRRSATRS